MEGQELHLHSMVVHAVIAFAAIAAVAFALDAAAVTVHGVATGTWGLLWRGSLLVILLTALPATLSGIAERNHTYANWPASHRTKLMLSTLLIAMTACEALAAWRLGHGSAPLSSALGVAIVAGNPLVCLALSFYGLRISLGRQSLARTSYVPDMHRTPPVDVLESVATSAAERPKVIEVLEEEG